MLKILRHVVISNSVGSVMGGGDVESVFLFVSCFVSPLSVLLLRLLRVLRVLRVLVLLVDIMVVEASDDAMRGGSVHFEASDDAMRGGSVHFTQFYRCNVLLCSQFRCFRLTSNYLAPSTTKF